MNQDIFSINIYKHMYITRIILMLLILYSTITIYLDT